MYQIGLVVMRNGNLGNQLTNYALYQYLTDMGYDVLMADKPYTYYKQLFENDPIPSSHQFLPYRDEYSMRKLNDICDMFVVGCDQLWRGSHVVNLKYHTMLNWVNSDKYKISYATSMGVDFFDADDATKKKMQYFFRRFQKIFVRESASVDLLRKEFGIDATRVLDPVFMCDRTHYDHLISRGRKAIKDSRFVGTYMLDPDTEKVNALHQLADLYSDGTAVAVTERPSELREMYSGKISVLDNYTVEQWLTVIADSEYVLTDSFHGTCLSLVFRKQFVVLYHRDSWRGLTRLTDMLESLDLSDRLIGSAGELQVVIEKRIDYDAVEKRLRELKNESADWLRDALEGRNNFRNAWDDYDAAFEALASLKPHMRKNRQ